MTRYHHAIPRGSAGAEIPPTLVPPCDTLLIALDRRAREWALSRFGCLSHRHDWRGVVIHLGLRA